MFLFTPTPLTLGSSVIPDGAYSLYVIPVAEYVALLEALQCALGLKAEALHVFSDSEVMVKQMSGEYNCRSPRLYSLNWTCRKLAWSLDFSISHVRRANNAEANRLASSAARSVE